MLGDGKTSRWGLTHHNAVRSLSLPPSTERAAPKQAARLVFNIARIAQDEPSGVGPYAWYGPFWRTAKHQQTAT